jgi:hypothetical protein
MFGSLNLEASQSTRTMLSKRQILVNMENQIVKTVFSPVNWSQMVPVRHKSGVTLIQALVWNVGTCRPDAKEETQVRGPHESESTDAGHRGGPTRISVEVSVMEMERRGWIIWPYCLVNQ